MGDLVSPRRRDVYDRLRRRIEHYRSHQQINGARQETKQGQYLEQQRQETLLYNQRWLESKAKRSTKSNKANRDSNSAQHTNNQLTQKLKRKLDSQSSVSAAPGDNTALVPSGGGAHIDHFKFDGDHSPPAKKCAPNTNNPNNNTSGGVTNSSSSSAEASQVVSVNIDVQQISGSGNTSSRVENNSQIKLTFQSTLHTSSTSSSSTNNNSCKQEQAAAAPQSTGGENHSSNSSYQDSISFDDIHINDFTDILDQLEKEQGALPDEFLKEIQHSFSDSTSGQQTKDNTSVVDLFNTPNKVVSKNSSSLQYSNEGNSSPSVGGMFAEPNYEQQQGTAGYCGTAATGGGSNGGGATMPPTSAAGGYCGPRGPMHHSTGPSPPLGPVHGDVPPLPTLSGDTGPAAETLKQMAAQHQNQDYSKHYDGYDNAYRRYPGTYQGYNMGPQQANMYGYNQQMQRPQQYMTGQHMKGDMSAAYGATKPLTHYPMHDLQGTGSSLQRLQNQVQTHFSQSGGIPMQPGAPQTHISQSQQMHMSSHQQHPHHQQHMHFSQTQHMQMAGGTMGGGISMGQQQSFSMGGPGGAGGHTGGPYSQPQQHPSSPSPFIPPQHQAHGGPVPNPSDPSKMQQQYMPRPPPEYKMNTPGGPTGTAGTPGYQSPHSTPQPNGGSGNNSATGTPTPMSTSGSTGTTGGGGGGASSPLETMQNMVSQQHGGSGGDMSSTYNISSQQNIKTEALRSSPAATSSSTATSTTSSLPSCSQASSVSTATSRGSSAVMVNGTTMKTEVTPPQNNYTSALMRGQRPPNVNVGPDGLNISQPRPSEWPRGPTSAAGGMMQGAPMNQQQVMMMQQQQQQYGGHPQHLQQQQGGYGMHPRMQHMTPQQQQHYAAMQQQQQQQHYHARTMGVGGGVGVGVGGPGMPGMARPAQNSHHHMMMMQQQQHMQMQQQQQQQHPHQQQQHHHPQQHPHPHMQQQNGHMHQQMRMSGPGPMHTNQYPSNTAPGPVPTSAAPGGASDFPPLDFLDSTQGQGPGTDFFGDDLLDDILNGK